MNLIIIATINVYSGNLGVRLIDGVRLLQILPGKGALIWGVVRLFEGGAVNRKITVCNFHQVTEVKKRG